MKNILRNMFNFTIVSCVTMTLYAMGTGEDASAGIQEITFNGSTSVAPLIYDEHADIGLKTLFEMKNPHYTISVSSTGSGDGISSAINKSADFGMASRALKAAEKGKGLTEFILAYDTIVPIVNHENTVRDISMNDLRRIYMGEITNWRELGGADMAIEVISRETGSGTRFAFENIVGFVDKLVLGASEFDGTSGVKAQVAQSKNAIGYISMGAVDESIVTLLIDGVASTTENVQSGAFTIARPFLLLYHAQKMSTGAQAFIEWVKASSEAHDLINKHYISPF